MIYFVLMIFCQEVNQEGIFFFHHGWQGEMVEFKLNGNKIFQKELKTGKFTAKIVKFDYKKQRGIINFIEFPSKSTRVVNKLNICLVFGKSKFEKEFDISEGLYFVIGKVGSDLEVFQSKFYPPFD